MMCRTKKNKRPLSVSSMVYHTGRTVLDWVQELLIDLAEISTVWRDKLVSIGNYKQALLDADGCDKTVSLRSPLFCTECIVKHISGKHVDDMLQMVLIHRQRGDDPMLTTIHITTKVLAFFKRLIVFALLPIDNAALVADESDDDMLIFADALNNQTSIRRALTLFCVN